MRRLRKKENLQPVNPIEWYKEKLSDANNLIEDVGEQLLKLMETAASEAGLDFKNFLWNQQDLLVPIGNELCLEYVWVTDDGTKYQMSGAAELHENDFSTSVSLWNVIPHKSTNYFRFDTKQWEQYLNLAENEKVIDLILQDEKTAELFKEIREYTVAKLKKPFTVKDVFFYREKYKMIIDLYNTVYEFMDANYIWYSDEVWLEPDACRHGFYVTCNENEYQLYQCLSPGELSESDGIIDLSDLTCDERINHIVWSGTDKNALVKLLFQMGDHATRTDVCTLPISIETSVEFRKADMSDLIIRGNNPLTDLEKQNLQQLREEIHKIVECAEKE